MEYRNSSFRVDLNLQNEPLSILSENHPHLIKTNFKGSGSIKQVKFIDNDSSIRSSLVKRMKDKPILQLSDERFLI